MRPCVEWNWKASAAELDLIRVDFHGAKEVPTGTCHAILEAAGLKRNLRLMITLPNSLVIEATKESDFFGFYSPDLEVFTGIGHSVEDCLNKARSGMADHRQTLHDHGMAVPARNPNPAIVIQNESKLQPA